MSSNQRGYNTSDESSTTKYSIRSFSTAPTSPPHGPDPEDSGWWASNRTHPIRAGDDIVKPWTEGGLREAVMGEVRMLSDWISVDILRRGVSVTASECPPTVVISIKPETMSEECLDVVGRVKAHIEDYGLDAAVEVAEDTVTRYQILEDDPEKSAGIGASIALRAGQAATGTLGGYVQLNKPGVAPKICALTCHHVVSPTEASSRDVLDHGLDPINLEPSGFGVDSPSEVDFRDTLQASISFRQARLEIVNETNRLIENGLASAGRTRHLEKEIRNWENATRRVSELQNLDRQLGWVIASSGYRTAETGCSLDWGLVEVSKERLAGNVLKDVGDRFRPSPGWVEERFEFQDGEIVNKFGRSSGFTRGHFSFIPSHVNVPDSPNETTEQVFVSVSGSMFSLRGDSGAWVLNGKGQLGGMIMGGRLQNGGTYVTPISVVFEDIETRLGCKVTLPTAEL